MRQTVNHNVIQFLFERLCLAMGKEIGFGHGQWWISMGDDRYSIRTCKTGGEVDFALHLINLTGKKMEEKLTFAIQVLEEATGLSGNLLVIGGHQRFVEWRKENEDA